MSGMATLPCAFQMRKGVKKHKKIVTPFLIYKERSPISWADLSEKATLHCAFSMRNGVKANLYIFG